MLKGKALAYLRWTGVMLGHSVAYGGITVLLLLVKFFFGAPDWGWILGSLFFTSWIAYPFAVMLKFLGKWNPLWIYLDPEPPHDWFLKDMGKDKVDWWAWYVWAAVRNPMWNFFTFAKPKEGFPIIHEYHGEITMNGKPKSIMTMAVLKGMTKDGVPMDNKGEYINYAHSRLGTSSVWYEIDGTLYFRKSFAGKFFSRWLEIQFGCTEKRYTWRFKYKKYKELT